mmetsp:Transcript_28915/g.46945  ORF Transcript_28915/g.46945 Transcript_28915/m.46945 type:complete len:286 (-) Transcript_28915:803-1660(-)
MTQRGPIRHAPAEEGLVYYSNFSGFQRVFLRSRAGLTGPRRKEGWAGRGPSRPPPSADGLVVHAPAGLAGGLRVVKVHQRHVVRDGPVVGVHGQQVARRVVVVGGPARRVGWRRRVAEGPSPRGQVGAGREGLGVGLRRGVRVVCHGGGGGKVCWRHGHRLVPGVQVGVGLHGVRGRRLRRAGDLAGKRYGGGAAGRVGYGRLGAGDSGVGCKGGVNSNARHRLGRHRRWGRGLVRHGSRGCGLHRDGWVRLYCGSLRGDCCISWAPGCSRCLCEFAGLLWSTGA